MIEGAKCIAVVPHLLKGGSILGGNGRGVATCRLPKGKWSAPAFFVIEEAGATDWRQFEFTQIAAKS